MKFRIQTEHAIELLGKLLDRSVTTPLPDLVQGTSMNVKCADSVIRKLRDAGLVKSRRGCSGGYEIGRTGITLLDIITAVEGPTGAPHPVSPCVARGYTALEESTKSLWHVSLLALTRG